MTLLQLLNVFIDDLNDEIAESLEHGMKLSNVRLRADCVIKRLERIKREASDKKEFNFDDGKAY